MRRKHIDILKKKILTLDYPWLLRQVQNLVLPYLSHKTGKCLNTPVFGGLIVTYRCNEACPMCTVKNRAHKKRELSTAAFIDVIDQFAELNPAGISITGGEPLVREDIFTLIECLKHHKIPVSMSTNGLKLSDRGFARALLSTRIDSIAVSIDGPDKATHDRSRGKSGAFERTLTGLTHLLEERQKLGLKAKTFITIATVINNENYMQFENLLKLAQKLGINNVSLNPVHNTYPGGQEARPTLYFHRNAPQTRGLVPHLKALKKKYDILDSSIAYLDLLTHFFNHAPLPVECYAPYQALYVDCYQDILPCGGYFYDGIPVMNLGTSRLSDIWHSEEYAAIRHRLETCRKCYYSCMAELSLIYAKLP